MASTAMLAHNVFFTLRDKSDEAKRRLTEACKECLAEIPGIKFFAAGTLADDIAWSVSDRNFDVALQIVFENKAAHDAYQESERHVKFMDQYGGNWKDIRVFDAYVE